MARIISIDFGQKRCGIAVTDPLQIIATGLEVLPPEKVIPFLKEYTRINETELILIGLPTNWDGSNTHATEPSQRMFERIKNAIPQIPVEQIDERFTSQIAAREMHRMGMKKSERRKKENVDIIAATMMLQEYLNNKG
jgi:putative Holliday junction resolvase